MLLEQLKIELKIYLRQPLYLLFSVVMPAISFGIFGSIYKDASYGGLDFFAAYIPGFCVIILFATGVFNVANQVVSERERGIYRRLSVTPVSMFRVMCVLVLKVFLISVLSFMLILLLAYFVFDITPPALWSFIPAFLGTVIVALVFGFTFGALFDETAKFSAVGMAIFTPLMLLSDATLPLQIMPEYLKTIAQINPLYRLNLLLRAAWDPAAHAVSGGVLLESAAVLVVLLSAISTAAYLRWKA
ncbi:ABC transporter permease [Rothia sp. CCM 9418]|uniref:ABC transporter permease n=1 Tax=Rothia sp. CCM 9418 TaxID=3402661 RepID=UPI003ADB07BD